MALLIQLFGAWLLADFVTGVFHWWEDRFLDENQSLEFFRGVATDNLLGKHAVRRRVCVPGRLRSFLDGLPFVAMAWGYANFFRELSTPL